MSLFLRRVRVMTISITLGFFRIIGPSVWHELRSGTFYPGKGGRLEDENIEVSQGSLKIPRIPREDATFLEAFTPLYGADASRKGWKGVDYWCNVDHVPMSWVFSPRYPSTLMLKRICKDYFCFSPSDVSGLTTSRGND